MLHYELLLSSRTLLNPRQLLLQVSAALDGPQLAAVLDGQVPGTRWYRGATPLEELGMLGPGQPLLLADVPGPGFAVAAGSPRLKLYVPEGPDAGAWMELGRGTHEIGRGAPLFLCDPQVSRVHARLVVDERSMRVRPAPGQRVLVFSGRDAVPVEAEAELQAGSRIQLGGTVLEVGDPARSEAGQAVDGGQLEFSLPPPPELGRLVTLCLAALVPVFSGVLLAVLTGSMLFLAVSGLSALLGVVPAVQLLGERRRWKRSVRGQQHSVVRARRRFACPLGTALVAGIDRAQLGVLPQGLPPLVFGSGSWQLPGRKTPPEGGSRRPRRAPGSGRSAGRISGVPVFAPAAAQVWQLLGGEDPAVDSLLAALLSRFLPAVAAGRIELVIDPSITRLPAELLLLRHVRQGTAAQLARSTGPASAVAGMPGGSGTSASPDPSIERIFLTGLAPVPLPRTLVISLHPVPAARCDYWVDPVRCRAKLPDGSLRLETPDRLDAGRLARIVQSCLAICPRAPASAGEPPAGAGLTAVIGEDPFRGRQLLDFDEDGPHVLVCGTTGSGKSEALRRIIADLAGRYSPEQLALVLVDFKGGAGLAVFGPLPHVQLSANDLDAAGAQRTLAQLEREVARRERLLAEHHCSDRSEYVRRSGVPALPRLLVVVDEFRVFIETLPEAAARIDRLAAVGRSLGIHLLLSTQRAAGALSGQTRANLNTVVALRVKDAAESMDLVGSPAAAQLVRPGSAVMAGPGQANRQVQFALAVSPTLYGSIAERGPGNLILHPVGRFGHPDPGADGQALHRHVRRLADSWRHSPLPPCPFAPQLPPPEQKATPPTQWQGDGAGAIFCGVVDDLAAGRLEDLVIEPARGRGLLVCGVPEAGGRQLFEGLMRLERRILCFGDALFPDSVPLPGTLTVNGEDRYLFLEALDDLESLPRDRLTLVLVHGIARLQSQLDPAAFQRFDQVLTELLRQGVSAPAQLVMMADRDVNLLKAAGLCAEQWYFPLNAADSLRMSWPKLPPTSQLPGRGVRFSPVEAPMTIQLTASAAKPETGGAAGADCPTRLPCRNDDASQTLAVGHTAFTRQEFGFDQAPAPLVICPGRRDREELAALLSERWKASLVDGAASWLRWVEACEAHGAEAAASTICVVLHDTSDPQLAALRQRTAALGTRAVLFVPPSARLPYDLGLPGLMVDDRQAIAVEARHPQDLLPLAWRPLPHTPGGYGAGGTRQWRAIAGIAGQPRAIIIER
ncbi:FtsK/SpoIIIE domain-containing protein [Glutamicibacter protophormiae]|uniref:FtsK/SpoIIIE domain-containing protein n=1 Tax=Glutamicibacter protophormiae TaxID=37930 RepID=UPI002A806963|nr:FtsK/SpoIIIE domain-containing protein [Glutamicibacter protophormiae]WPR65921.1 FtsK/SpoIIIE domain-containing protein [Glutamicibacter protophormiae]WPR69420.1 FtsK/SpoIIIE domain-containing protein [Glutamicibacter protophormiae]